MCKYRDNEVRRNGKRCLFFIISEIASVGAADRRRCEKATEFLRGDIMEEKKCESTQNTVAEVLVKCLENEGVKYVFGIPGEENLDMMNALEKSDIRVVVVRHEQGAAFMADMYGRLMGKAGVCFSTLGPGATNLITGTNYVLSLKNISEYYFEKLIQNNNFKAILNNFDMSYIFIFNNNNSQDNIFYLNMFKFYFN